MSKSFNFNIDSPSKTHQRYGSSTNINNDNNNSSLNRGNSKKLH